MSILYNYMNMKITIKEKNQKWWLDFYHNGKRVRKSTKLIANDVNLKEIKKVIIPQIVSALKGSSNISLNLDITLDDFSHKFFQVYKNTVRTHVYKERLKQYKLAIYPFFKDIKIIEITPLLLEEWQSKLLIKYKLNSYKIYKSLLNLILKKAYENNFISFNPFDKVSLPKKSIKLKKLDEQHDYIYPFNTNEINTIFNYYKVKKNNIYYFLSIMLYTGMRPGEILALTWNDIDFHKKRIAIDKKILNGVLGDVKTQSSVRYVDILPQLEILLLELKSKQKDSNIVLSTISNTHYYSQANFYADFVKTLKKHNIPTRTIYNLRHTFASTLISESSSNILYVSNMLGHANLDITLKIYAKFIKEDEEKRLNNIKRVGSFMDIFNI